jgi:multimeric flavodoxin WrbA
MKVLGLICSPKREGNTAKLVEAVLRGAGEAGHHTEVFYLCDMNIGPLEARGGNLIYPEDDMERLYPHIESMDALVIGTPIYYDQVSARAKIFFDRLHFYSKTHGEEYRGRFPDGVKAVTVTTQGAGNPDRYDDVLEWMKGRLEYYWNMEVVASLKAASTGSNPVQGRAKLLEKAMEIGRNL